MRLGPAVLPVRWRCASCWASDGGLVDAVPQGPGPHGGVLVSVRLQRDSAAWLGLFAEAHRGPVEVLRPA